MNLLTLCFILTAAGARAQFAPAPGLQVPGAPKELLDILGQLITPPSVGPDRETHRPPGYPDDRRPPRDRYPYPDDGRGPRRPYPDPGGHREDCPPGDHRHDPYPDDRRRDDGRWERPNPGYGRGYALEEFRRFESEVIHWNDRYRGAPSGSWEERHADQRRREAMADALSALRAGDLAGEDPARLEGFAREMAQKYRSAPSGSLLEQLYNEARRAAWEALRQSVERDLRRTRDWREALREADRYDQLYRSAPSGSLEEQAYDSLRRVAWEQAQASLDQELSRPTDDFRGLERLAGEFDAGYRSASSGSRRESFYNGARRTAYDAAFGAFERWLGYSGSYERELWQLEREYDSKYRSASSGSLAESYFRRVRDAARSRLDHQRGGGRW